MPNAPHHHQVSHTATQTVAAHPAASLNTLPPWTHSPIFLTFAPCFVVLALLMIRHRHNLYRRGERLERRKTKPAEYVIGLLFFVALKYGSERYPAVAGFVDWPYRHIAFLHDHPLAATFGFFGAAFAAQMVSALYAALFLRGGGGPRGGGMIVGMAAGRHTLLPDPPAGYGWFSPPQTTRRMTRQRTYRIEEE